MRTSTRTSTRPTTRALAAAAVVAASATGCGGDVADDTTDGAGASSTAVTEQEDADEDRDAAAEDGDDEPSESVALPDAWPDAMPLPEGATVEAAGQPQGDSSYMQVLAHAEQSVTEVADYYRDVFEEHGWEVTREVTDETLAMWHVSGNGFGDSKVELHQQEDGTSVMLDLYAAEG